MSSSSPPPLARALRRARVVAGLSVAELAGAVGKSRSYVSQVESGRIEAPPPDFIEACERELGLPNGQLARFVEHHDLEAAPTVDPLLRRARSLVAQEPDDTQPCQHEKRNSARNRESTLAAGQPLEGERLRIAVLEMLSSPAPRSLRSILLTSVRQRGPDEPLFTEGTAAGIACALRSGWDVDHLMRLDYRSTRVREDLDAIVRLMACEGKYAPVAPSDRSALPYDVLAVPGIGILVFNEDRGYFHAEHGLDPSELFFSHASAMRTTATPIFQRYRHHTDLEEIARDKRVVDVDTTPGETLLVTSRLSFVDRPDDFHLHALERRSDDASRARAWFDNRRRQLHAFDRDINDHWHREILSQPSLDSFFTEGWFEHRATTDREVPKEDRLLVARHMRSMLRDHRKYDIRLEENPGLTHVTDNAWQYKATSQGPVVFLFAKSEGSETVMSIEITDAALAEHFRSQFEFAWQVVENRGFDRDKIEQWLDDHIERLVT